MEKAKDKRDYQTRIIKWNISFLSIGVYHSALYRELVGLLDGYVRVLE
jgi:hypothetical protein